MLGLAMPAFAQVSSPRFAGAPRIGSTDGWSVKPRGRVLLDFGDAGPLGSGYALRRARLGVEGTAPHGITYALDVELAQGIAEITQASVTWEASEAVSVTLGQHNNFQALEELTSSRFISFVERAAFTDAFNFGYRPGASVTVRRGDLAFQAGLFTDNLLNIDEADGQLSLDGRLVYAPRIGDARLHLAASAHWRDTGDRVARGGTTRYRQRPLTGVVASRPVSTPNLPVLEESMFGLEAAYIRGPLHAAAEAHWLRATLAGSSDSPTFFGGYVELGWFLTGESRGYRNGRWDRTRVRRGGAIEEGGSGAFQVIARYDRLDLNSAGIRGGTQDGLMAGLTWIPTDHVRFLANYARLSYRDAAIPVGGRRNYGVDVFAVRAQLDF
jgi:phosphate-selective porin OprO/OprP